VVIKGTVHNGMIRFENSELPEGTQVLITPVQIPIAKAVKEDSLEQLKREVHRIASLASESDTNDSFTGADHDKLPYGGEYDLR